MTPETDVLSQLAKAFRLEGAMGGRFALSAPWGYAAPKGDDAMLLVVVRGRVHFELREGEPRTLELGPGDVVALPHGSAHALSDDPKTPLEPVREIRSCPTALAERYRGGQTELLLLACRFSRAPGNTLLRALPP
ncbi:MAG: cupin domain-containing protein, partial [Hyphomicrobiales bacterium]